jgi:outer membrane murein-binding lipoprotein Lpp
MSTPTTAEEIRTELSQLEAQIAELQRTVDDMRSEEVDPGDRAAQITQAEQQEALISQLDVRRRDLMERLENA